MSPQKEKLIGCGLYGGCAWSFLMIICLLTVSAGGFMHGTLTRDPSSNKILDAGDLQLAPIFFGLMTLGVISCAVSLAVGISSHHFRFRGPKSKHEFAKVLSKYAMSDEGVMLTNDWEFETEDRIRFYVRLQLDAYTVREYECERPVYYQAGEGMTGEAHVQGSWLGQFIPYIG